MLPFRTILVAGDFSENSREAFRIACTLAHPDETRLTILHAEVPPILSGELDFPLPPTGDDRAHREALVRRLREFYAPDRPLRVEHRTRDGFAAEEILRVSDEVGADLIVLGTHGRTGLHRLLVGSIAEAVLRRARCPVLAVRSAVHLAAMPDTKDVAPPGPERMPGVEEACGSAAPQGRGHASPIRTILCPTDFSDRSAIAIPVARSLARDHGARLVVLNVAPVEDVYGTIPVLSDLPAHRETLEGMREILEDSDLKAPVETQLRLGQAAAEILQSAEELRCDLIVMGTHGRTGLGRALMGSVAEAVLRGARCPVLMIKAPVAGAAETAAAPASSTTV
jgi:nucleotide-binding universal stress UspA family protein